MRPRRAVWIACGLALALVRASAQTVPAIAPETQDALRAMSQSAAVIFSGQVVAVRRLEGVVEIDFAVEDAVRGVSGALFTLREWAGLWTGNDPLRVGQRYLMLLHAAGPGGLSSPVGGVDGAIPVSGGGAADGRMVDLRLVAIQVPRAVVFAAAPVARPISPPVVVRADARGAQVDLTATAAESAAPPESAAYSSVLGLLRGWERASDAVR